MSTNRFIATGSIATGFIAKGFRVSGFPAIGLLAPRFFALAAAAALMAAEAPALAHHSTAMFDFEKTIEITGTVQDFQWTNPHTWTNVAVEGGGAAGVYGLEGMSPNYLSRNGWTKRTLNPGDKLTFAVHPLKDGRKGGFMVSAKLPDGTVLYNLPRRPETSAELK